MAKRDIGAQIVAGLKEFRDKPEKLKRYEFEPADVKGIRQKFGMTQQQFADFLIAVEAEMTKVSWPSRGELVRSSIVVILVIFLFGNGMDSPLVALPVILVLDEATTVDARTLDRGAMTVSCHDDVIGLGDIIVDPIVIGWHRGNWHYAAGLDIYLPVGEYDQNDLANVGRGYWTFEPVFAATYRNADGYRVYIRDLLE